VLKEIPGFEGLYGVTDKGRVWSASRTSAQGHRLQGQWLCPIVTDNGHLRVSLRKEGRPRNFYIHRLVLSAFVGPCPIGSECCHNNGNPADNRLDNLRWDTKSANAKDSVIHGALLGAYDLCHANRRLGTAEVLLAIVNAILLL
jgi:hypothetical protein